MKNYAEKELQRVIRRVREQNKGDDANQQMNGEHSTKMDSSSSSYSPSIHPPPPAHRRHSPPPLSLAPPLVGLLPARYQKIPSLPEVQLFSRDPNNLALSSL
uniref:Uncharacterized protein n=1 Tax=Globodera rostochiensis TaxID=31243 RepID=A0A914HRS9_GLORO